MNISTFYRKNSPPSIRLSELKTDWRPTIATYSSTCSTGRKYLSKYNWQSKISQIFYSTPPSLTIFYTNSEEPAWDPFFSYAQCGPNLAPNRNLWERYSIKLIEGKKLEGFHPNANILLKMMGRLTKNYLFGVQNATYFKVDFVSEITVNKKIAYNKYANIVSTFKK